MTVFENLYIHIPFCRSKCGYCAFYSETGREDVIDRYLDRLEAAMPDYPVQTVYVGGGTPTLLSLEQLERLGKMLPPAAERSIESNPETLDRDKVRLLAGFFNRISTGVQSFDASRRRLLGRGCSDKAIFSALELIAGAPFAHRNIDLIYAIGGQSRTEWRRDLETALSFPVDHLSCYALTFEEHNRLSPELKPDRYGELEADLSETTLEILEGKLPRYEISNYARSGGECRHNLNVWRGRSYLGIGASASGFDGRRRFTHPASIEGFLTGEDPEYDELPPDEREMEIFIFNLRTVRGWAREEWESRGGDWRLAIDLAAANCETHPDFWRITPENIRLTRTGLDFWDTVAEELLP